MLKWDPMLLGLVAAFALGACHGQGGGGGGAVTHTRDDNGNAIANVPKTDRVPNAESYDSSNPTSREESNTHALPLRAVPNQPNPVEGVGIISHHTARVLENGRTTFQIDVNHASPAQLMRIPGIGLNLADAIVMHRPYQTPQDLARKVPQLDRRRVASFQPFLRFTGSQGQP